MKAKAIQDAITLTNVQEVEGETILETDCRDYDHFITLPSAVVYDGKVCGKSGWSSDRNYACYKSNMKVAYKA